MTVNGEDATSAAAPATRSGGAGKPLRWPDDEGVSGGLSGLLLTVLGTCIGPLGGWMPISGLIKLMAELDVDAQAVRSAVSRLKRRGVVVPERRSGAAGYVLSPAAARIDMRADRRVYRQPTSPVEDGWVLVVFSVPDARRADRHVLRQCLTWLGFGNLAAAVWLAPGRIEEEARDMLVETELDGYVRLFRAHYRAYGSPADLVRESWDLPGLEARYREFLATAAPIAKRWSGRRRTPDDRQAMVDHITLVYAWRLLPWLDPGLPQEALPRRWPGVRAWELFTDLDRRLEERSLRYAASVAGPAAPLTAVAS